MAFQWSEGEDPNLESAVHQAVGMASMCWDSPEAAGVFDSDRALEVTRLLLDFISSGILREPEADPGRLTPRQVAALTSSLEDRTVERDALVAAAVAVLNEFHPESRAATEDPEALDALRRVVGGWTPPKN